MSEIFIMNQQLEFTGAGYEDTRDRARLAHQHVRVRNLMGDGAWRTLSQISKITRDPPASVSAQLRHMRKPRFGAWTVDKRYLGKGLYQYRAVLHPAQVAA